MKKREGTLDRAIEAEATRLNEETRRKMLDLMGEEEVTVTELARRLHIGPQVINHRLHNPELGMTLNSVARMARAMGYRAVVRLVKLDPAVRERR